MSDEAPVGSAKARIDSWLWVSAICLGLMVGLAYLNHLAQADVNGISLAASKPPTWDFTNLWYGGRLALEGHAGTLVNFEDYRAGLRTLFAPYIDDSEWSYPPTLLLIAAPLALLPLYPAYILWTAGTLGLLSLLLRRAGLPLLGSVLLWISPGALNNILFGQNGALTAFLLFGGLLAAQKRPMLAGICFALLLAVKPHLGLLVPVCLVAVGAWRTISWSAFFAILLAAFTALCFGTSVWMGFFATTQPLMQAIMEAPYGQGYHANATTVFASSRGLGLSVTSAYLVQLLATLSAAFAAWQLWRRPVGDPLLRAGATGILTLLATPYGYSYDMVMLSAAVLIVVQRGHWNRDILLIPVWLWPAIVNALNTEIAPLSPLALIYAAAVCIHVYFRSKRLEQVRLRQIATVVPPACASSFHPLRTLATWSAPRDLTPEPPGSRARHSIQLS